MKIAQFFELFRDLWDGFHQRSIEVQTLLGSEQSTFLLVSSPAPSARREALYFLDKLSEMKLPFGGFLINRAEAKVAFKPNLEEELSKIIPADLASSIVGLPSIQNQIAIQHQRSIDGLLAAGPSNAKHWVIPDLGRPVNTLDDLLQLGESIPQLGDLH